jgi:hypothetical protein
LIISALTVRLTSRSATLPTMTARQNARVRAFWRFVGDAVAQRLR